MPITLVATLPKSTPPSATGAPADADVQDTANSFASMLLGQLAQVAGAPPGKELLLSEAAGTDASKESTASEDSEPTDALALLAALGASTTAQADASPATANTDIAKVASQAVSADANPISTPREGQATQRGDSSQTEMPASFEESMTAAVADPANRKPATFAVPEKFSTDSNTSSTLQSADPATPSIPSSHSAVATAATGHSAVASGTDSPAIPTPLRDPHWNNDFAQKIVWLASNQKQAAELTLNPPNMGSIEVSLRIDNDQATATFVSTNAEVRETIETALPRLREMLAGVGISLGQANVSAESFRQATGQGAGNQSTSRGTDDNAILAGVPRDMTSSVRQLTTSGRGLVDLFA